MAFFNKKHSLISFILFFIIAATGFTYSIYHRLIFSIHGNFIFKSCDQLLKISNKPFNSGCFSEFYKTLFLDAHDLSYGNLPGFPHFLFSKFISSENLFDSFYVHLVYIFLLFFMLYRISLLLFDSRAAIFAMALFMINSGLINYSRSNYIEFPLAVFINCFLWMIIESERLQKKKFCFLAGLFLAVSGLIKYNTYFYLFGPLLFIFYHFYLNYKQEGKKILLKLFLFIFPPLLFNLPWYYANFSGICIKLELSGVSAWGTIFGYHNIPDSRLAPFLWFFMAGLHITGQYIIYLVPAFVLTLIKKFKPIRTIFKTKSFETTLLFIFLTGNYLLFTVIFPIFAFRLMPDHWLPNFITVTVLLGFLLSEVDHRLVKKLITGFIAILLFYQLFLPVMLVNKESYPKSWVNFIELDRFFNKYLYFADVWAKLHGKLLPGNFSPPPDSSVFLLMKEISEFDYKGVLLAINEDEVNLNKNRNGKLTLGILTNINLDMSRNFLYDSYNSRLGNKFSIKAEWEPAELEKLSEELKNFNYFILKNSLVEETISAFNSFAKYSGQEKILENFRFLTEKLEKKALLIKKIKYIGNSSLLLYRVENKE